MPGPKMCRMRLALGTLVITGLVVSAGNVVQVSDTASLYAAINDPANAGKTVHLKAGVYLLNANSPLVLQPGMSLEGETVLVDTDGDGLPDLWEVEVGLDPRAATGANGAEGDPDDDELNNRQEFAQKTDPWEVDLLGRERVFLPVINR